jgi:hypothetical protein
MSDSLPCRLAFEGNIEQLKQLVEEQPGRAVQLDEDGRSCLHWAITGKQRPIVEYLMGLQGEAKPRVNVADEVLALVTSFNFDWRHQPDYLYDLLFHPGWLDSAPHCGIIGIRRHRAAPCATRGMQTIGFLCLDVRSARNSMANYC